MKNTKDPIYSTYAEFGAGIIHVIGSDEDELGERGTSEENYQKMKKYFNRTGVETVYHPCKINSINFEIFHIAKVIIEELKEFQDLPVIFDPTAGRMEMSYILTQAGHLAFKYWDKYLKKSTDDIFPGIYCCIRPRDKEPSYFWLIPPKLPDKWVVKLLEQIKIDGKRNNEILGGIFDKDRSTVGRQLNVLQELHAIEREGHNKQITDFGEYLMRSFFEFNE